MITTGSRALIAHNVVDNMMKLYEEVVAHSLYSGAEIAKIDESFYYYSGSSFQLFNGVLSGKDVVDQPAKHFANATQFFASRSIPFVWWWLRQSPIPQKVSDELQRLQFKPLDTYYGVAAKLNNFVPIIEKEHVEIREVTLDIAYRIWINILSTVNALTETMKADYVSMFQFYGPNHKLKHFLAYYNGEPVATLSSYINGDEVGLYNAATLPHMRGQGICTMVTQHAIIEAKKMGCRVAVAQLPSADMAKNSEKLGFNVYCKLLPFGWH